MTEVNRVDSEKLRLLFEEEEKKYSPNLILSISEASALYRILINEWIPLDDTEAHEVARKIVKFVDENKKES